MSKFLTGGMVAGAFSMLGAVSVASGYPAFGAFLADPSTAATVTVVASGIAALVAGGLKGLKA